MYKIELDEQMRELSARALLTEAEILKLWEAIKKGLPEKADKTKLIDTVRAIIPQFQYVSRSGCVIKCERNGYVMPLRLKWEDVNNVQN